ncbi:phage tail protein [Mesorhizobium sp. ISC11]|uniref:phage tail protein n=1 Tax=Mesorhizobium sp. ISC11 TaxID=3076428 RepID=UPI00301CEA7F
MAGKKTITQRIALDGGKDIEKQLKSLGAAGEKAFKEIQAAANKANFDRFTASLSKVRTDLATIGKNIALLGAGLTAAAAGAGAAMFGLAKSSGEVADKAGKAAQTTGLQVEAFTKLQFAAEMANVSNEQFVSGMGRLNKAIAEAAKGTDKAGDTLDASGVSVTRFGEKTKDAAKQVADAGNVFTRLGVKVRDANGKLRSNEAILLDVADAFARMPDSALKSALAIELFGKAGAELLPFLNEGKAGLFELGEQAKKLGVTLTDAQAAIGDDLGDSLDSVSKAAAGARLQLGLVFAPGLTALANGFADIIANNRDLLVEFGQTINRNVLSVVGDLLHLLSGNSQNIKNPWIKEWSAAIVQFGNDVAGVFNGLVLPAFKLLREGAQFVAEQINKVFGTDITGGELALGAAVLSLVGAFTLLASTISAVIAGVGFLAGVVGGIPLAITAAVVAAGIAIAVFWEQVKAGSAAGWQYVTDGATAAWGAIAQGATDLWSQIVGAFQSGQQMAVDAFNAIVEAIVAAWGSLSERLGTIAQAIVERIVAVFQAITARISAIFDGIVGIAQRVLGRVSSLVDSIISKIKSAIDYAKQLAGFGGGDSGGGGSSSRKGFAAGGSVRGPGGPRSDSILARLSAGEFVIQAKVVRQLGVDFFHRLNNGFLPAMDSFRGFSIGGFADNLNRSMQIPRFADGGLAKMKLAPAGIAGSSGLTTVRLDFGLGPQDVVDLIGEGHVIRKLQNVAVKAGLLSTGRKPLRGTK